MNISDVENLAELAKLELSQEEKEAMLHDMEGILGYVKQIESVDVGDIEAEYPIHNIWREDTKDLREFSRDIIVEQFPNSQPARLNSRSGGDGIFLKVKKIL